MPRSDEEHLALLREERDKLMDAWLAGEDYTSYRIGDREKSQIPVTERLNKVEKMIHRYERRTSEGGGRNLADFSG